ncbi:hypothetical protein GOODEAATRI_020464 [Goodea atripinnis]|uniref:Uncharacterized protein n=1 Tax=Goodea atripinnis TaxID=208336 RepID=A0ABV0NW80_9TELE
MIYCMEIQTLEDYSEKYQRQLKKWVGGMLLYSSLLYLITLIVVYFWYLPEQFMGRLTLILLFVLFPFLAPSPECHSNELTSGAESCERFCCPPSSRLWARLSWSSYPFCSRRTPREGPVSNSCSAKLDEEAHDPGNTCSRSR